MPTEAIPDLLDRDLSKAASQQAIEVTDKLLRELVNNGTWVLRRCTVEAGEERDIDLPALVLYRHLLELTDAVQELLHQCCVRAAVPLVRAAFEACLCLEHLLQDRDCYGDRARAWLVERLHRQCVREEDHDPEIPRSARLREAWAEELQEDVEIPRAALEASRRRRQEVRRLLEAEDLADVWEQYKSLQRGAAHVPHWYSVAGGPVNLRSLAEQLGHLTEYELWYRRWSSMVHGSELGRQVHLVTPGEAQLRRLRDGRGLRDVAFYSATYVLRATFLILSFFRPGEDLKPWYVREVRNLYRSVTPSSSVNKTQEQSAHEVE